MGAGLNSDALEEQNLLLNKHSATFPTPLFLFKIMNGYWILSHGFSSSVDMICNFISPF